MNRFGKEAVRRYLAYCGVSPVCAIQESIDTSSDPLPEMGGHSTAELVEGLERFFDAHLGPEWEAPEGREFMSAVTLPRAEEASSAPMIIVGLTGERECGKSVIGDHLVAERGFVRLHPFGPGKALLRGYYEARGASSQESSAMTDGDKKNEPSPYLPVDPDTGEHRSSRWLMERLGSHMAIKMGMEWTIGAEIRHHSATDPGAGLLIESLVYEEDTVREMGGVIIRVSRHPDLPQLKSAVGEISDAYVNSILHDGEVLNRMDGKDRLITDFENELARVMALRNDAPAGP